MVDLSRISGTLRRGDEGIWAAHEGTTPRVSFPSGGHAECLQIEDDSFWFRHRNACLLEILRRYPPGGVLFELGAGNGFVASTLEKAGYPCVAVEPAAEGARNARRRGVDQVVCATLEDAAFTAGSLPAMGLFDVIEHIEHAGPFLEEVARGLAPGGRVYVTVPAYDWLWSDEDAVAGHFRRYRLDRIGTELEKAGLSVEYATYFFSALVMPVFLFRTIPRRLRGGRAAPVSRAAAQHTPRTGLVTHALISALNVELRWLRAGHTLPFGSSCLVVARKSTGG